MGYITDSMIYPESPPADKPLTGYEGSSYSVHESRLLFTIPLFLLAMAVCLLVLTLRPTVSDGDRQILLFIVLPILLIICILFFYELAHRRLEVLRAGVEYCYYPFIGRCRPFTRHEIDRVRVYFSPTRGAAVSVIPRDDVRAICILETNMTNINRFLLEMKQCGITIDDKLGYMNRMPVVYHRGMTSGDTVADTAYADRNADEFHDDREETEIYVTEEKLLDCNNHETLVLFVKKIREHNDILPDKDISDALDTTENLLQRIIVEIEKDPSVDGKLRRTASYYLPQIDSLLNDYYDLFVNKKDFDQTKTILRDIVDGVTMLNGALRRILEEILMDTAMRVNTDLKVMKIMLEQDGIIE